MEELMNRTHFRQIELGVNYQKKAKVLFGFSYNRTDKTNDFSDAINL